MVYSRVLLNEKMKRFSLLFCGGEERLACLLGEDRERQGGERARLRGREGKRGRENKKFVAGGLEKSGECPEHKADCKQPKI